MRIREVKSVGWMGLLGGREMSHVANAEVSLFRGLGVYGMKRYEDAYPTNE